MNPSPPDADHSAMEVRGARASTVIVQRIPPAAAADFMQWQRGISASAAESAGYQTTEVYPPTGEQHEWVVVIHFDDSKALQDWLDSPKRAEWVAKLPCESQDYRQKLMPAGFGPWFIGVADAEGFPPHWKMALVVLVALYPIVMLVSVTIWNSMVAGVGLAFATLVSNTISVCLLEWIVMPAINLWLAPWLRARGPNGKTITLAGLGAILVLLPVLALLFRLITG